LVEAGTKIRPIQAGDSSSFIIHDNSSEMAKFIPEKYIEPIVIIARIQGFDRIDDYIIHLIKDKLEMFADTSNNDDLDNAFQKYIHNMIISDKKDLPNTWTPNHRRGDLTTKTTTTAKEDDTKKPEEEEDMK
jgi:hypothetical protein